MARGLFYCKKSYINTIFSPNVDLMKKGEEWNCMDAISLSVGLTKLANC